MVGELLGGRWQSLPIYVQPPRWGWVIKMHRTTVEAGGFIGGLCNYNRGVVGGFIKKKIFLYKK